jgi:hypothetical protein
MLVPADVARDGRRRSPQPAPSLSQSRIGSLIDDYVVDPKQLLHDLLPIELLYADVPAGVQSCGRSTFVMRPRGAQIV